MASQSFVARSAVPGTTPAAQRNLVKGHQPILARTMAAMGTPAKDPEGSAVADSPRTHRLDVDSVRGGRALLIIGLMVGPYATITGALELLHGIYTPLSARLVGDLLWMGMFGLACLFVGLRFLLFLPTAGAQVRIDSGGLVFTLRRGHVITIPWSAVGSWGLAPRLWGRANSLVLWPSKDAAPEIHHAARKLWSKKYRGWVVETLWPRTVLIADLEKIAPCPRRDITRPKARP
jgi:hypothetical protein